MKKPQMILAIDPGTTRSAIVVFRPATMTVVDKEIVENNALVGDLSDLSGAGCDLMAIEMVVSMGMAVGEDVFETVVWIGRFIQTWVDWTTRPYVRLKRHEIKKRVCHNLRATDSNIRQAIIDQFPASGGGKTPQIGTKAQPGPLYGVAGDMWQALAVALVAAGICE